MRTRRSILLNLALSVVAGALFLGALESLAGMMERRSPAPPVADYIWDWDEKMPGGFYTIRSEATGWPPGEEINGDGLRDRTHPEEKPPGFWRVAALGDSVTLGAETRPEEGYPQLLEARLQSQGRRIEVMNVGLWGWSTRQERIAYQRIVRRYAPDQVLLGVCLNDIPELSNNLARPPRWLAVLHERSALARRLIDAAGREIRSVEQLFEEPGAPKVRRAMALFFDEVRLLRKEVEDDGARFAMLVLPFRFQVGQGAPAPVVQQEIASFCAKEKIELLDLLPALRAEGAKAFADYDHLSPSGAAVVAEAILGSGLLPNGFSHREALARRFAGALEGQTVPSLGHALADRDAEVRAAAAWALGRTGKAGQTAVPALIEALRADPSAAVRAAAGEALGGVGARGAIPALFAALSDESQNVRWTAARALSRLEPQPDTVGALVTALMNPDGYVRSFAAWTLGEMGPSAGAAVPALTEALAQPEGYGRGGASAALAKMGPRRGLGRTGEDGSGGEGGGPGPGAGAEGPGR